MARPVRAGAAAALLLTGLLSLPGCGEAPATQDPAGGPPPRARWDVLPASPAEQARFALERLLTGPVPQTALVIPEQHADTLRLAKADLLALGPETLRLLDDERLVARVTGPDVTNLDGWHSVLEVLSGIRGKPPSLALRWTEPALARDVAGLTLRAVDVLASLEGPEGAPLLLRFLKASPEDRSVQREAWRALGALPPPWPAEALREVVVRGLPEAWLDVSSLLGARLLAGEDRAAVQNLLGWWALLAEPGGPRPMAGVPRQKTLPWCLLAASFEPALPRPLPGGAPGERSPGPAPGRVAEGLGWLSTPPGASAVLSPYALSFVGTEPASEARCALATQGVPAFVAAVRRDRESADLVLAERARHCMLEGRPALDPAAVTEQAQARLAWALQLSARGEHPTGGEVAEMARRLPSGGTPEGRRVLGEVLDTLRPVADWLAVLEAAYQGLFEQQDGSAQERTRAWLAGEAATERGLALHLVQKTRDPQLLDALEALLARATPAGRGGMVRVLWWIYAGGGAEPGRTAAFAARYARWVSEAPDPQALSLAPGLLDLGAAGEAAFIAGLEGERSALFVEGCASRQRPLPLEVAEALADLVDRRLPSARREQILVALWRAAPAQAAPAIAGAKGRLDPADRAAVDVVLEVVRHRAARP